MGSRQQTGYTLLELMITVAILSIIMIIALNTYMGYTTRTRVAEGLVLIADVRTKVADYYNTNNALPTSNSVAGVALPASITGSSVQQVEIQANGDIEVTFFESVEPGFPTMIFRPIVDAGSINWNCQDGGTLLVRNRPPNCR